MFLNKYKAGKEAVLLVNADPQKVRVYTNSTRGIVVDEYEGEKLNDEAMAFIDEHELPLIRFRFANLEAWGKELPLTEVGNDRDFEFPWQEGRQAPVSVLATLLSKADCEIKHIAPMALTPEMMVAPSSENKVKNLAGVLSMDVDEVKPRLAKAIMTEKDRDRSAADPKAPLGVVIHGIERKLMEVSKRADALLKNSSEVRDDRQFMNSGGQPPSLAMAAAELAFLSQIRNHASMLNLSVMDGKTTKPQALTRLTTTVKGLESEFRTKSLKVGTDIDIAAIEYYGKFVKSELIPAARNQDKGMDRNRSVNNEPTMIVPL